MIRSHPELILNDKFKEKEMRSKLFVLLMLVALVLSACGGAAATEAPVVEEEAPVAEQVASD